jgi:hypothetical protein
MSIRASIQIGLIIKYGQQYVFFLTLGQQYVTAFSLKYNAYFISVNQSFDLQLKLISLCPYYDYYHISTS